MKSLILLQYNIIVIIAIIVYECNSFTSKNTYNNCISVIHNKLQIKNELPQYMTIIKAANLNKFH